MAAPTCPGLAPCLASFLRRLLLCLLAAGALASTGEFSLVLLERIADFGVFDLWPEAEQVLLVSTALGMGLIPALMRLAERLAPALERRGWLGEDKGCPMELTPAGEREALRDHVIVCGFGPVGRNLYSALGKCNISVLVLELIVDRADADARDKTEPIRAIEGPVLHEQPHPGARGGQVVIRAVDVELHLHPRQSAERREVARLLVGVVVEVQGTAERAHAELNAVLGEVICGGLLRQRGLNQGEGEGEGHSCYANHRYCLCIDR